MRFWRVFTHSILMAILLASKPSLCQEVEQASGSSLTLPLVQPALSPTNSRDVKAAIEPAATGSPALPGVSPPGDPLVLPSLFDGLANHFDPVMTSVVVHGTGAELDTNQLTPFKAGGEEVILSAGTFGDISRFLQTFPGVVASSDLTNEIVVRGGHPMENLFLVDGIEVPNINHVATLGTTGGFAPMIDSGVVQGITLFTGGYGAQYPERLSSVTEIQTLDEPGSSRHAEADLGIQGFGGLHEQPLFGGDFLLSGHQSTLNWVPGVDGVDALPTYTNLLSRFRRGEGSENQFSALGIAGRDSVRVTPCAKDWQETSSIDSQYSAWRETLGAEWQHMYSSDSYSVVTVSDSEQVAHIHQEDQIPDPMDPAETSTAGLPDCPIPAGIVQTTPVYSENSNDSFSTAGFRFEKATSRFTMTTGAALWLYRPNYQINQPIGAYSPYSVIPVRTDATSFTYNSATWETGTYLQFAVHPTKAMTLSAGGRVQTFPIDHSVTYTPRLSLHYRLAESMSAYAAYAQYAQLPPFVYLVAFPQNRTMAPMRVSHEVAGMDLEFVPKSQIHIEAYKKDYTSVPASTEYPAVTLHDMADLIGQQIVWLPMNSGGWGTSSGIEISDFTRIRSSFTVRGSIAYSRAKFAGLDGILRPSNFDFPWIANVATLQRLGRGYEISTRFGYATGRPYTPYDLPDSLAQDRPIYDVANMNAVRAPYFSRLDVQMSKDAKVHNFHLELYCGVGNILDRQNFLTYLWMPRNTVQNPPVTVLYQLPIFPNFGTRLIFK
jgi:hypothetical protein